MTLAAGTKLGPYEILTPLGAGGMGEVYRARDARLGREVAIKVLPAAMANDAERMARFQREAQMLASLNHPNIASIYGLEESGATRALVMELVEGPTLAERLKSGAIPLDDALPIAKQIAEALEYAHEKGIIHRDLKPANLKVTPEGAIKVLDFGLAKALDVEALVSSNVSNSPTLTGAATQAGVILGTAAYMSPEQARGKKVDKRADIWGFGVVLYEMLTGRQAFEGETTSDTLAAVIMKEPDWQQLPPRTPPSLRKLLRRCLDKDPKRRLRDIGEMRIEVGEAISAPPESSAATVSSESAARARGTRIVAGPAAIALAATIASLALLVAFWLGGRHATPAPQWSGDLLGGSSVGFGPRISPDGRTVAFQAMVDNLTQVAVLNPDSGNWTVLTHERSQGIVQEISWSRDGSKLYFDRLISEPKGIYTVPSLGGEERLVLEDAGTPEALPDGSLVLWRVDPDRRQQIYHYWPDTGRLQPLGAWLLSNLSVAPLRIFPDGREAVFFGLVEGASSDGVAHLYALDVATGKSRRLAPQLPIREMSGGFPLAATPDNGSVLVDLPSGNLHQIVAIPRFGSGPAQVLITMTTPPWTIDAGPDGNIYVDQVERPLQLLRFSLAGGTPEVVAVSETYPPSFSPPVEFPDGRFLLPAVFSGHSRLLIGKQGGNFFPLVDSAEDMRLPAALLPNNQVAFIAGMGSDQTIAIASAEDSRIIRHFQGVKGVSVSSLAASPDGGTLYYTGGGDLWAIPAADGTPRKICAGDVIAVDPNGRQLIVGLQEKGGTRLVRVPLSGGMGQEIQVQGDLPIAPYALGGNSVGKDGKLLIGVSPKDSWFFGAGVLDLATDKLTSIPLNYTGDIVVSGWTSDGQILAFGLPMRAHIWRFRPMH
jgi:eukaryotic-like serine/threonine-protein kinase